MRPVQPSLSLPTCVVRAVVARCLIVLLPGLLAVPMARAQARSAVTMPAAGTPARKGVLDAVRRHLRTTAVFKVAHLAVSGPYAFVRAGEVVPDGETLQETDLFVEAMLERTKGRWRVLHLWSLADEGEASLHDAFVAKVRRVMREQSLPIALLPEDLHSTRGA
jgi:hypothetical protein